MIIKLMKNFSEKETIGKRFQEVQEINAVLLDGASITNPMITVKNAVPPEINYAYIPDFKRYYFVEDITNLSKSIWQIQMRVDVLESFKDEIKANNALMKRNEFSYNMYLNDGEFEAYQDPIIIRKKFQNGLTDKQIVLSIAG